MSDAATSGAKPRPARSRFAFSKSPLFQALSRRDVQIGMALALLTLATYASVFDCDFVSYDDPVYVVGNIHVQRGLTLDDIVWSFTTVEESNWHPLTWLSFQLDLDFFEATASACHRTNLILHILNVLLLYGLLVRMTGSWPQPALVAALFAVHPLHVESVAWITERKDVLSTFFGLLTVAAYLGYVQRPTVRRYLLLLLLYAASLMAKQMLVTLPFLLLLLDWWPLRRLDLGQQAAGADPQPPFPATTRRRLLVEKLPLLLLALAASAATVYAQNEASSVKTLEGFPLPLRLANTIDSTAAYLRQTVWPTDLAVFYPYPRSGLPWGRVAVEAMLLLGITILALLRFRTRPYFFVGWLWFLGTLAPVIGILQVGEQARADRYTYVPHIGLFLAVVWGFGELLSGRRRALALGLAALLVLSPCVLLTYQQIGYWHDSLNLWEHSLAVTEDNTVARTNCGQALYQEKREAEAYAHWQAAVRLSPQNDVAQFALGNYYIRQSQGKEVTFLGLALGVPGVSGVRDHLRQEALLHYRAALAARPNNPRYQEMAKNPPNDSPP